MNSIKNLNRLKRLHQLIRSECTGTPYELSRRLHVSERLVYLLVEQLRDFDALIDYDRSRQTYYYRELFDLEVDISVRVYNKDQMIELYSLSGSLKLYGSWTLCRGVWLHCE